MTHPYITPLGHDLDDAIGRAMAAGYSLEAIFAELAPRFREVQDALIAKHLRMDEEKCAA
jgi:hypothetical protein